MTVTKFQNSYHKYNIVLFLSKQKTFFLFFAIIFTACFFWLLNFFPAIMMPDTFDQWRQMESFSFNDWHPVFHSLFFWLTTRLWHSPAAIAVAQIIMFSAVVSWILTLFISRGMRFIFALLICVLIAFSPLHASMSIYLVKDVPFAISFLFLNGVLFSIFFPTKNDDDLNTTFYLLVAPLALLLTSLFRHNGLPVAIGVALIIFFKYRSRHSFQMLGVFTLLYFLITVPLYKNVLHVNSEYKNFLLSTNLLSQVAAHKNAGTYFKEEENIFLANLVPSDSKWIYNPTNVSNTITQVGFPKIYFLAEDKNSRTLISIAAKLSIRNPLITLKQMLDMSGILFYPTEIKGWKYPPTHLSLTQDGKNVLTNNVTATPSDSLFPQKTFFPTLDVTLVHFLDTFRNIPLIVAPSFHFYFFAFIALSSCLLNRSTKDMIFLFPTFLLILFLIPMLGSDEFRYYYPIYLTSQIFSPFIILRIYYVLKNHWMSRKN